MRSFLIKLGAIAGAGGGIRNDLRTHAFNFQHATGSKVAAGFCFCIQHSTMTTNRKTLLISFSGLDGSGKSTQIANLVRALHASGYRTKQLAFWDNVVVGSRYRESFVHKAYKSESGIGAPGKPVERRDKNVRRWYLTLARHLLYFADAIHLRFVVGSARLTGADVSSLTVISTTSLRTFRSHHR